MMKWRCSPAKAKIMEKRKLVNILPTNMRRSVQGYYLRKSQELKENAYSEYLIGNDEKAAKIFERASKRANWADNLQEATDLLRLASNSYKDLGTKLQTEAVEQREMIMGEDDTRQITHVAKVFLQASSAFVLAADDLAKTGDSSFKIHQRGLLDRAQECISDGPSIFWGSKWETAFHLQSAIKELELKNGLQNIVYPWPAN